MVSFIRASYSSNLGPNCTPSYFIGPSSFVRSGGNGGRTLDSSSGRGGGHPPSYNDLGYSSGGSHDCGCGPQKCMYYHEENHTIDCCWDFRGRLATH